MNCTFQSISWEVVSEIPFSSSPSWKLSKLLILVTFLSSKDVVLDVGWLTNGNPVVKLVAVLLAFSKRWSTRFEMAILVSQVAFCGFSPVTFCLIKPWVLNSGCLLTEWLNSQDANKSTSGVPFTLYILWKKFRSFHSDLCLGFCNCQSVSTLRRWLGTLQ